MSKAGNGDVTDVAVVAIGAWYVFVHQPRNASANAARMLAASEERGGGDVSCAVCCDKSLVLTVRA